MKKLPFFFFAFLFLASPAWAATYWVSTSGNNSNGCTNTTTPQTTGAKLTIQAAMGCLTAPGDTLNIRAGTYDSYISNYYLPGGGVGGTSWNSPITIQAYTGETVIVKPTSDSGGCAAQFISPVSVSGVSQYIILRGVILDGSGTTPNLNCLVSIFDGGASGQLNHIRIDGVETRFAIQSCIFMGGANQSGWFSEVINSKIHDCGSNHFHHGVYVTGSNTLVQNTEIYNISGYGIHNFEATLLPSSNTYAFNYVHNVGTEPAHVAYGILLTSGTNNKAYRNIVANSSAGIQSDSTGSVIYDNTIYGNGDAGGNGATAINVSGGSGQFIRNNIVFGNTLNSITTSGNTADHNLTTDPLFVNPVSTTGDPTGFKLQAGSGAINTGTNLGSPYQTDFAGLSCPQPGNANCSIGVYERATAVTPFTVTIQSVNPSSGASITVSPTDNNSVNNGTTGFTRVWNSGTTITLTAALNAGGNNFSNWSGCTSTSGTSGEICTITNLSNNLTVTATFSNPSNPPRVLTVTSNPSAVPVACNGTNKLTPYTITVADGTALTCLANHTVSGPVARWNLTAGSGTTETDQSGNGNTITFTNTSWVGTDLTFNGTTSYGATGLSQLLNVAGDFTIAATVTPSITLSGYTGLAVMNYSIFLEGAGIIANCSGGAGPWGGFDNPATVAVCSATALTSGVTYKLIITRLSGVLTLYKDGSSVGTPVTDSSNVVSGGAGGNPLGGTFTLGRTQGGDFFTGKMRDARYYGRGFSAGDVTAYGAGTLSDGTAFGSWQGCTSGSGATCNVTMTQDRTVTAQYPSAAVTAPSLVVGTP